MPSSPEPILASECIRTLVLLREGGPWVSALVLFILEEGEIWGEGWGGGTGSARLQTAQTSARASQSSWPSSCLSTVSASGDWGFSSVTTWVLQFCSPLMAWVLERISFLDKLSVSNSVSSWHNNQVHMILHPGCLYSYVVPVCSFARAAITKDPKPSGLNNRDVLSHSSGGQKPWIKVLAGWVPSKGFARRIFSRPLFLPGRRVVFMFTCHSPCMHVCLHPNFLFLGHQSYWIWARPCVHWITSLFCLKTRSRSEVLRVGTSLNLLGGAHFNP